MPLESLSQPFNPDEPGRKLREVQIEHESVHEQETEFRERYEALKEKSYDPNQKMWVLEDDFDRVFPVNLQLLDVVLLAELNGAGESKNRFLELKRSILYDAQKGQWRSKIGGVTSYAEDQLLAIWAEQAVDTQHANSLYKGPLPCRSNEGNWIDFAGTGTTAQNNSGTVVLLSLLIESKIDALETKKKYDALKQQSGYFDASHEQWKHDQAFGMRNIGDQCLGILLEMEYDVVRATQMWERLKKSALYDADSGKWRSVIRENQSVFNDKQHLSDQLMVLLVETRLFHKAQHIHLVPPVEIPEERNF